MADIWAPAARGHAVSIFVVCVFIGPVLGPVVGSLCVHIFVKIPVVLKFGNSVPESHLGWRGLFWIMMIATAVCGILMTFFMPETYTPVLLQWKVSSALQRTRFYVNLLQARRLRMTDPVKNAAVYSEHDKEDWSLYGVINRTLFRPFFMLYREPILVFVTLYLSFIYGILYARESPYHINIAD
jgi:MFS transporter, DHA1 family, multidrug resistance protein